MSAAEDRWPTRLRSLIAHNIVGALALAIAVPGTAYAAVKIGSKDIVDNSIQSVDVKDRTLRQRDLAPVPWRDVKNGLTGNCATGKTGEFCFNQDQSGYFNYGEGFQTARFRQDATGEVKLQGLVRHYLGGASEQHTIFVLPVGHRPAASLIFPVACGSATPPYDRLGAVQVDPNGRVSWREMSGCEPEPLWVSLTGIGFPGS